MKKEYILNIVNGKNPSDRDLIRKPKQATFTYSAEEDTARALGIKTGGEISFSLTYCEPCPALKGMFIVKDNDPDSTFRMEGIYYPKRGFGRFTVELNQKKIIRPAKE